MLIYRDSLNKYNKDSKNYKRETTFERYITRKNIYILRHYTTNKPLNVAAINIEKMKKHGKYIYMIIALIIIKHLIMIWLLNF